MDAASQIIQQTDTGRVEALYTQLHAAALPSELADTIGDALEPLLAQARADHRRLHALTREAEQRVLALERLAAAAKAVRDGVDADHIALTGRHIADTAIQVANQAGRGELHYREWFQLFREQGHFIAGDNPEATFLTSITRHPDIERAEETRGVYRVARAA